MKVTFSVIITTTHTTNLSCMQVLIFAASYHTRIYGGFAAKSKIRQFYGFGKINPAWALIMSNKLRIVFQYY